MRFIKFKNNRYKKNIKKLVEDFLNNDKKVEDRHIHDIADIGNLSKKDWLKISIILLKELKLVCKEKNVTNIDLVTSTYLQSRVYPVGLNFSNEAELIENYNNNKGRNSHMAQTPDLVISSHLTINENNKELISFELDGYENPEFQFYYAESPPNEYDVLYNRRVFVKIV